MRKIINLTVLLGCLAILALILFSQARAADFYPTAPSKPDQIGPAWFDEAWQFRKPVVITNSGAMLQWYQVLIVLEAGNFDFSRANADGSDVRFTSSDGITELSYWIESWDSINHRAYIWVRVPNIATGNNTIFLYYDNLDADTTSNGYITFDSFDDEWSQFTGLRSTQAEELHKYSSSGETYSPFTWITINGAPQAAEGILNLADGDGIRSSSSYLYNAIGMRAEFTSGSGNELGGFFNVDIGQKTMIGDIASDASNLFLINSVNGTENVLFPRVGVGDWHNAYHVYEVRWKPNRSTGDIDHGLSIVTSTIPAQVPSRSLPVTLYSLTGSNATLKVDWVYVRQYRDPEPSVALGNEQGLVALSIDTVASPDPVQKLHRLTYQLTISNTSEINALGVVFTDTLPINVQMGPVSTSQGSCTPGSVILCSLNTINAGSSAWITINITPTVDGELTNIAEVGSTGYELDTSDNLDVKKTLVDTVPPAVNWQEPTHNGGTYFSTGGLVTLEASATDYDQVAWVEFKYWDHMSSPNHWVIIGRDDTYPYQVQFDTNILVVNASYQTFAYAADRAGNQSDPYNPLQRIFLGRKTAFYLPIVRK